jgi:hypothetical protein
MQVANVRIIRLEGCAMKFYGRAQEVAERILEAFKSGNVPKALAPVFINRNDNVPCRKWSWCNQFVCILNGTDDARGFRQWEQVGRNVRKGARAFQIFVPLFRKLKVTDSKGIEKEIQALYGFKSAPVFALESTDGKPLPPADSEALTWIDSLPLVEVARVWNLKVDVFDGRPAGPLGKYIRSAGIALGVKNLSTWAHELVHAADDKLGNLKERGQHWRSEVVAELGGAVLLESLGLSVDSDRGGCWQYVTAYASEANILPLQACMDVLKRTCDAVSLILEHSANQPCQA